MKKILLLVLAVFLSLPVSVLAGGMQGSGQGRQGVAGVMGTPIAGMTEIKAVGGEILAFQYKTGGGLTYRIDIVGDPGNKPDEGNELVDGTVQWGLNILTSQAQAGDLNLIGGGDYIFKTALSSSADLSGIHINCFFGKRTHSIQPANASSLTAIWDFGDGTKTHSSFKVNGCHFYGKAESGHTSIGVRFNNFNTTTVSNNTMVRIGGAAVEFISDGSVFSSVNWIINNNLHLLWAEGIKLSGAGGGFDLLVAGNFMSADPLVVSSGKWLWDFGTRGGGSRIVWNHILNSYGLGCWKSSGGGMMVVGNYLDSCTGVYWDSSGNGSTVTALRMFNNGVPPAAQEGLIFRGNDNNIMGVVADDNPSTNEINHAVTVFGDRNSVGFVTNKGNSGNAIRFEATADSNVQGIVNGTNPTVIDLGTNNVRQVTEAIP